MYNISNNHRFITVASHLQSHNFVVEIDINFLPDFLVRLTILILKMQITETHPQY